MDELSAQVIPFRARLRYLPQIRGEDADLIFEFFMVYSRFEFALKQVGFRNSDRGYLKPDWVDFGNSTEEKFNPNRSPGLSDAYNYYLNHPPKIQSLLNGKLIWTINRKKADETDFAWVIRSIGIVRNNLFHGGKFPWDQVRDVRLLSHGLTILYDCLDLDESVFRAFTEMPE